MNNIKVTNPSISFNGLIINGTVPEKSIKKLGDFASHIENTYFIKELEDSYGVDAVLNNEITEMTFSSKAYGNLSQKFGCGSYRLENVFRDASLIIKDIKASLKKAAKEYEKQAAEKEAVKRGC